MLRWERITIDAPPGTPFPTVTPMADLVVWLLERQCDLRDRPAFQFAPFGECLGWRLAAAWGAYPAGTVLLTRRLDSHGIERRQLALVARED